LVTRFKRGLKDERPWLTSAIARYGTEAREAVPVLVQELVSGGGSPLLLDTLGAIGPEAAGAVEAINAYEIPAPVVGLFVVRALWRITGDAEPAIALLAESLGGQQHPLASLIAATLGADAAPLAPQLRSLLHTRPKQTVLLATALWRIERDPAMVDLVIAAATPSWAGVRALAVVREMGLAAAAIEPVLVEELARERRPSEGYLRGHCVLQDEVWQAEARAVLAGLRA